MSRPHASASGDDISDELLLLRMMLPEDQVEAMLAAPRAEPLRSSQHPLRDLVAGLVERDPAEVEIDAPGLRLRARRHAA